MERDVVPQPWRTVSGCDADRETVRSLKAVMSAYRGQHPEFQQQWRIRGHRLRGAGGHGQSIVPQLIKHGESHQVWPWNYGDTRCHDSPMRVRGVVIRQVAPEGPAARAELKSLRSASGGQVVLGDVVTGLNGEAVRTVDDLFTILDRHQVGDQVTVEVVREGKGHRVSLTLQAVE